ncbi:addiction module antidote protein, HigA family [Yersinia ruckeri]|uniref:HigA family addiction module antitoxin n=1 Tax=Yersinia ruckeri TaxID=29486 RepID=UPI0008FE1A91|nr:HigA family addiction module antitoxin [Yersinia ruckeri]OJC56287.1 addiction module antidote protein, HigA family [Yersinia ruckeri]OJC84744.1 addiction module antidote protein, HigA family [Yersinia ruckeri]OJC85224.1 addiction module antidote protein, HigA family [Yersinia ruckeri]
METISREPTTVGVMLLEEFIKPLNIKYEELSDSLSISLSNIEGIIYGNKKLHDYDAIKLAVFFKTDIDFWINVRNRHEHWEIKNKK